jgi:hypothetical protein
MWPGFRRFSAHRRKFEFLNLEIPFVRNVEKPASECFLKALCVSPLAR